MNMYEAFPGGGVPCPTSTSFGHERVWAPMMIGKERFSFYPRAVQKPSTPGTCCIVVATVTVVVILVIAASLLASPESGILLSLPQ